MDIPLPLLFLPLFLLCACSSPRRPGAPEPAAAVAVAGSPAGAGAAREWAAVHGQYADPSCGSFPLYEVYLANTGAAARVFTAVSLGGRPLRRPAPPALDSASVSVDGLSFSLPAAAPDPEVAWWQFYPSAEAPPGGAVCLRLCFRGDVRAPRALAVADAAGAVETLSVPRRSPARVPLVSAVSYSADLRRVFILCDSPGNPPEALWVGGARAGGLRVFAPSDPRRPFLAAADAPEALRGGAPVWLRVRFADGRGRQALLRALPGVSVYDAPASEGPGGGDAPPSGVGPCPCAGGAEGGGSGACGAVMIPEDAVCSDLRSGRPGGAAWRAVTGRERLLAERPDAPAGFAFCTGLTPDAAAVYGRIADALFAKPYRLGWGRDPARFLDEEADALAAQRASCAPLPFLYVPERFSRRGRGLSPSEAGALEWGALAAGAKGLRRHFAFSPGGPSPELAAALGRTAAAVRRLQPLLAPLLPVSDETQGSERSGYVRVLTAWAGPDGALFYVRDRSAGAFPDGPPLRRGVAVSLDVPPWFRPGPLRDLLSGEALAEARPGRLAVNLPELRGFRLLWADADPSSPLSPDEDFPNEGE